MQVIKDIPAYLQLMRVDKPIGWLLLLWPTLIALWFASEGQPDPLLVWVFVAGVFIMRCAGCVINDYADRDIDPKVERTRLRPLADGRLRPNQALLLFVLLGLIALGLLSMLPRTVWPWALPAIALTVSYPYMKRFMQAPQLVLGLAFSFGIPMVYVSLQHAFDALFWLLFVINVCWVLVYDTEYAMSDKPDDVKVGVNSSAILLGQYDRAAIAALQILILLLLWWVSRLAQLDALFICALVLVAGLFVYQQVLIRERERGPCFAAFLNNGWVGAVIWFGILTTYPSA